jgi:hypothetical protein
MDETVTRIDQGMELLHAEIAALRAEVMRLRRIEAVALEFCARCERGEIRSTNTYVRFMSALRPADPVQSLGARPRQAPQPAGSILSTRMEPRAG